VTARSAQVVQAVADAAPWWGVPLIAGAFLIVGALMGFVNSLRSDRARFKREDARRWDAELLARAGAYMTSTAICFDQLRIFHESIDHPESRVIPEFGARKQAALAMYQTAFQDHIRTQQELFLIAPAEVRGAATQYGVELISAQIHESSRTNESISSSSRAALALIESVRGAVGVPVFEENKKPRKMRGPNVAGSKRSSPRATSTP
jgi:hypothetical protein